MEILTRTRIRERNQGVKDTNGLDKWLKLRVPVLNTTNQQLEGTEEAPSFQSWENHQKIKLRSMMNEAHQPCTRRTNKKRKTKKSWEGISFRLLNHYFLILFHVRSFLYAILYGYSIKLTIKKNDLHYSAIPSECKKSLKKCSKFQ